MDDIGNLIGIIQVVFWLLAGGMSFYFSIGNARVWTSISVGFFLIFLSQFYLLAPWADYTRLEAVHYIIGTVAIMVMTHGFQEYYVFSRTLDIGGSKAAVYLGTLGVICVSSVFIFINPEPTYSVLRNIKMIENASWVFLAVINIDLIRKIYAQIRDSVISKGFVAFGIVFFFIFLWKGSELYLQVFCWDNDWHIFATNNGIADTVELYSDRIAFSVLVNQIGGMLSALSVGGTFIYLYRLLR
ncbi:hypothetical protein [Geobacter sp. AOG1]|uniref:hypothetical protein n=1 Tax=Geobacter sp. AOG1 TaxID=1566346 RepID=UPI001CC51417|nr:hypothetical protein [Geobacter sp. AOG1]GFE58392.1 hypothetical protein AOG1_22720 [Geobacter sp. AOG1]